MEAVVVGITDRFPDTLGKHRIKFVLACCVVCFILGLPLTTKVSQKKRQYQGRLIRVVVSTLCNCSYSNTVYSCVSYNTMMPLDFIWPAH